MNLYNVTFITRDWHIGTTVVAENDADATEEAVHFLSQTARIQLDSFQMIDINVAYVGEVI
jgi:hypothetical protein